MAMQKTALNEVHKQLKAKMTPFAGYEMPLQYSGVKDEVLAVRDQCGVFDVSHMGEFLVKGEQAIAFVDHIMTNDFQKAEMGKAVYSPLCNEEGFIIDDFIAYKITAEEVLLCVNASNIQKDWDWISKAAKSFAIELSNISDDIQLLAVQGPKAEELLNQCGLQLNQMSYYSVRKEPWKNSTVTVARTGYTGEDGFEVFCSADQVKQLWSTLLELGATPCGLAARDVLRIEVGYPLYGQELDESHTPKESGLAWTIGKEKNEYLGKQALEGKAITSKLVKFFCTEGIPRIGYKLLNSQKETIGTVTSGTMSPTLQKGIGIARVAKHVSAEDIKFIEIRNKIKNIEVTKKPFVSGGHK